MSEAIVNNMALPMDAIRAYCRKWGIVEFALFGSVLRDDFYNSALIQSAVVRELQVIGEAARLISENARMKYGKIEWRKIMGMRNRVIHEYFDIRADLVWDVVQNDIPELIEQLEYIVPPEV